MYMSYLNDKIVDGLRSQGVTDCFHITIKSDNNNIDRRKTNTFIFTFNTAAALAHINVGYLRIKVDRYIPNPLRCFKCQTFGHSSRFCRNEAVCHRCGGKHTEENCNNAAKCTNCSGPHGASSRVCPVWLREKRSTEGESGEHLFPPSKTDCHPTAEHTYVCGSSICGCLSPATPYRHCSCTDKILLSGGAA